VAIQPTTEIVNMKNYFVIEGGFTRPKHGLYCAVFRLKKNRAVWLGCFQYSPASTPGLLTEAMYFLRKKREIPAKFGNKKTSTTYYQRLVAAESGFQIHDFCLPESPKGIPFVYDIEQESPPKKEKANIVGFIDSPRPAF
jgi:hypothetical protein